MTTAGNPLMLTALNFVNLGIAVFPVQPDVYLGWSDASVSEAQIRAWWDELPDAHIGSTTYHHVLNHADAVEFMAARAALLDDRDDEALAALTIEDRTAALAASDAGKRTIQRLTGDQIFGELWS